MTATSRPTLDTLPNMRDVAVVIATEARDNLAGVDVVSVGPLWSERAPGGMQYGVFVIVPERDGKEYSCSHVVLDIGPDPFMAIVYRTGLIIAFEEFLVAFRVSATR